MLERHDNGAPVFNPTIQVPRALLMRVVAHLHAYADRLQGADNLKAVQESVQDSADVLEWFVYDNQQEIAE